MSDLVYALTSGIVLLLAPGWLLARALRVGPDTYPEEKPALWSAFSLALLSLPAAVSILVPVALSLVVLVWSSCVLLAACGALVDRARARRTWIATDTAMARGVGENAPRSLVLLASVTAALLAYGAYAYTGGGSIDRWWYLAFVRSWLVTGQIAAIDPFFATTTEIARFSGNAWLLWMALWAEVTGIDPVFLYERAAPALLALLALSAAAFATRAALESRTLGLVAVTLAALYWTSGGMFPALTRLPEDKLVASLTLAPVLWGLVVRTMDSQDGSPPSRRLSGARLLGVAAVAVALASVHPLVFGIALVTVVPALLRARLRLAVALAMILAAASLLPLALGTSALDHVAGAESVADGGHPVQRIHFARDRIDTVGDSLSVSPRLLAHPLTVAALAAAFTLVLRRRRERLLLSLPTAVALLLCFVPKLSALVADVIGPWMLYRVLWAIPVIPLLACLASFLASVTRLGFVLPLALAVFIAAPRIAATLERRSAAARTMLATPSRGDLPKLAAVLRTLPADSLIAAAPELSERIPGLTGRNVLAASDRATVVFSGSAESAYRRLSARAALMAGLWRPAHDVPTPTHVLYEPGAPAGRYCAREVFASGTYVLCELGESPPIPGLALRDAGPGPSATARVGVVSPEEIVGSVDCVPPAVRTPSMWIFAKPGPWSARSPGATCTVSGKSRTDEAAGATAGALATTSVRPRALAVTAVTGRAVDEILVVAIGRRNGEQRWHLRTRREARDDEIMRFVLPRGDVDEVEVLLVPSRLPFVKLRNLFVELDETSSASR